MIYVFFYHFVTDRRQSYDMNLIKILDILLPYMVDTQCIL